MKYFQSCFSSELSYQMLLFSLKSLMSDWVEQGRGFCNCYFAWSRICKCRDLSVLRNKYNPVYIYSYFPVICHTLCKISLLSQVEIQTLVAQDISMDCFQEKQVEFGSDWNSILPKNTVTKNALDANCSWIVAKSPHSMLLNHVFMDTSNCWLTPDSTFLKTVVPTHRTDREENIQCCVHQRRHSTREDLLLQESKVQRWHFLLQTPRFTSVSTGSLCDQVFIRLPS